jgi:hypothetical protein
MKQEGIAEVEKSKIFLIAHLSEFVLFVVPEMSISREISMLEPRYRSGGNQYTQRYSRLS